MATTAPSAVLGSFSGGRLPGVLLCAAVTAAALGLEAAEVRLFARPWIEALVLAILLGAALRTVWNPGPRFTAGIDFSAHFLLELAVALLGATVSAGAILAIGPALLLGIAALVAVAIVVSYGLGRLFGLPRRMAMLIACGNAICGNSAIAAVAPVIGADEKDVAASIAFTAVLGVGVVLALPVLAALLGMSPRAFGAFAGLTVYAVPQVLAATLPTSALAAQTGTLVKLVRVLMLGPVVVALSLLSRRTGNSRNRPALRGLVPWFILGFLGLATARALGLVPDAALSPMATLATWLTIVSMAALGLGVDVRVVAKAGPRVTAVVSLSLLVLGLLAWLLIRILGLA